MANNKDKANEIFGAVRKGATGAAEAVAHAGMAAGAGIAKGAIVLAKQAVSAKQALDKGIRDGLDAAYAEQKPKAVKNVDRLRKANPQAKPADILNLLEAELKDTEKKTTAESDTFTSAAKLFVLSAVQVHANTVADKAKRQTLIDLIIVIDSKALRNAMKIAAGLVMLLSKRVAVIATIFGVAAKAGQKVSWLKPLLSLAEIKNPGKKSASMLVAAATRNILGAPPKAWPAAKTATKSAAKPASKAAAKPAAKKPAAKPAAKKPAPKN